MTILRLVKRVIDKIIETVTLIISTKIILPHKTRDTAYSLSQVP